MNRNANPAYPIVDGFRLNTLLKCDLQFIALATKQFEAMRRSGAMRSRSWLCPESNAFVIPAHDAYEYAIPVVPGSLIWGFIFVTSGNAGPFSVLITESCTDVSLFSEVIRGDTISGNGQRLLTRPLVIPEPGLINVQICSQQGTDATGVQLVLCGGEPATV